MGFPKFFSLFDHESDLFSKTFLYDANNVEVGRRIEAYSRGQGAWIGGKIIKCNLNGTCDVLYDTSETEKLVPLNLIRVIPSWLLVDFNNLKMSVSFSSGSHGILPSVLFEQYWRAILDSNCMVKVFIDGRADELRVVTKLSRIIGDSHASTVSVTADESDTNTNLLLSTFKSAMRSLSAENATRVEILTCQGSRLPIVVYYSRATNYFRPLV